MLNYEVTSTTACRTQGSILVDPNDLGTEPRVLLAIEHEVTDASGDASNNGERLRRFVGNATPPGRFKSKILDFVMVEKN